MKQTLSLIAALWLCAVLLFPTQALAGFLDGNDLHKMCGSKNVRDRDTCLGYAMGVSDIMDGLQATGRSYFGHKTCATKALEDTQVRDAVANYLKAHPERRQYGAANLVAEALAENWPCPLQ